MIGNVMGWALSAVLFGSFSKHSGIRLALLGIVMPATAMLAVTLFAATHTCLQGILITATGMAMFIAAMVLIPRLKRATPPLPAAQPATA